ncbi:MAG: glycosyltransferase family 4 protein [Lachnospiraceae bacterium]|nr:glycosyltransferase family 4 protein [Lachnospiraceae bacterium]
MKLVFAHDHKLREIDGKYYTLGGLRDSITDRYMEFFDELTIFCRAVKKQEFDTGLFELKNPKVTVKPVSNGSLILTKEAKLMMEEEISKADGLIVKLHSKIAEYAIHCARKHNVPYLVESVGCPWDAYWNYSLKGKFVAPIMTLSTKRELKRAPYAVYVTKEFLERRYPCKGNWIDCSDVELKDTDDTVLAKRLDKIKMRGNEPLVLGTLAQVDVKYKGQEYVIRALAELKKQGKIVKYRLAGSGSSDYLRSVAEECGVTDQVEFCGVLSHDDVFPWLDEIDFYIQPSKQEGLPRAMIEAISRACPAAGSTAGGMGELVEKEYIFRKGNVGQIVQIINSINADKMMQQAKKNFETSQNYRKDYLDEKRRAFYAKFAQACKENAKN